MRSCHFTHALAAFAFAAISSPAGAQFYIRFATTLTGTAECDASTVAQAVTGTLDLNLPSAGNNVYESKAVNGGPPAIQFSTTPGSFPASEPLGAIFVTTPSPQALPYTMVELAFPAANGQPVGTGVRIDMTCNADESATMVVTNDIAAPAPIDLPATDHRALALLAGLVVLAGFAALRRRARVR
jgi:hypothetical protein